MSSACLIVEASTFTPHPEVVVVVELKQPSCIQSSNE
jgi:hypothetical protein